MSESVALPLSAHKYYLSQGAVGGGVTKPACQYGVQSEIEEANGYLDWPDEAVTPTLKSSQIATLAAVAEEGERQHAEQATLRHS